MYYTYGHYKADSKQLFYIGKGKGRRAHDLDSRSDYWRNIVKKHGFTVEILSDWKTEKEAFEHEKFLIECFRDLTDLCNLTDGGDGCSGYIWTEEQKKKIKNRKPHNTGKIWDEQTRLKISLAQKGIKRRPHTKEHAEKIAKYLKGKKKSPEHIAKRKVLAKQQSEVLLTCPNCGHQNYGPNIFRWHFDNCKGKAWKTKS